MTLFHFFDLLILIALLTVIFIRVRDLRLTPTKAEADVIAERARQITEENYDPQHDDQINKDRELAAAAFCYIHHYRMQSFIEPDPDDYGLLADEWNWPWDTESWNPQSPRRDLVKAAALIIAEIERIDRKEAKDEH